MPSNKPRITVIGSANTDLITTVLRFPNPGETITGHKFTTDFGGKGANQAVMAARMGADVDFIGRVGDDPFGEKTRENFAKNGISTEHMRVDEERESGVALITVNANDGENTIIVIPGANHGISSEDVETAKDGILSANVILAQLEIPTERNLEAFKIAKSASDGPITILNPAPAATLPDELLSLTDIITPNEHELGLLTNLPTNNDNDLVSAATSLLGRVRKAVIVTLGARGCLLLSKKDSSSPTWIAASKVTAVDTVGAGDAFVGSLGYFLAAVGEPESERFQQAVERAVKVASITVTRRGVQSSYPTKEELDFLQ